MNKKMNKKTKPNPKDYHAGCLLHDDFCIEEQMKAGCTVDLFVCFNCRELFDKGLLEEVIEGSNRALALLNILPY